MNCWRMTFLPLLLGMGLALPVHAQTGANRSEDARQVYLRRDNLCLLKVGAFIELPLPKYAPTPSDLDLMDRLAAVSDRLAYDSDNLALAIGPAATKAVNDSLIAGWKPQLQHGAGQPDNTAILRAEFTPDLQDCIATALTLDKPPAGWEAKANQLQ